MARRTPSRPPAESQDGFGPVKRHLTDGGRDHAKGWEEPTRRSGHKAEGGHVVSIDPKRVLVKTSLAEQFSKRAAEGKDAKH
jgi:hypothetical protein